MDSPKTVMGANLGLAFPTTIESLLEQGSEFLTAAFHRSGALADDNRVVAIRSSKEFVGGGMGRKLVLEVEYQRNDTGLHRELFLKFPRDFGDPLRELFSPVMEPEVQFALLTRDPRFPVRVPRCYFGDFDPQTLSGLLITERVRFGENGVEPFHDKCLDYQIDDALPHYEALTRALARLAGGFKAGSYGEAIRERFGFDAGTLKQTDMIPYDRTQLGDKLEKLQAFAAAHARLLPASLLSDGFLDRFCAEVPLALDKERAIKTYLNSQPDYVSLCHWNANIDNAWFYRDERGVLQAGLLDWGSVSQMNLAQGLYGMLCAAEPEFLSSHLRRLIELFVSEYRASGGPELSVDEFMHQFHLSVSVLGAAWMLDAPALVEMQVPKLAEVQDRFDPPLHGDFLARAQLHLMSVYLHEWKTRDIGSMLRRFS